MKKIYYYIIRVAFLLTATSLYAGINFEKLILEETNLTIYFPEQLISTMETLSGKETIEDQLASAFQKKFHSPPFKIAFSLSGSSESQVYFLPSLCRDTFKIRSSSESQTIEGDSYLIEILFSCITASSLEEIREQCSLLDQNECAELIVLATQLGTVEGFCENLAVLFLEKDISHQFKNIERFSLSSNDLSHILLSAIKKSPRLMRHKKRVERMIKEKLAETAGAAARAAQTSIKSLYLDDSDNVKIVKDKRRDIWCLRIKGGVVQNLDGLTDLPLIEKLEEINLPSSSITHLESGQIDACESLKYFKVSGSITEVEEGFFNYKHQSLEVIDLSSNPHLDKLPGSVFCPHLTRLETINLSATNIRSIPRLSRNVRHLFLDNTPIDNSCFHRTRSSLKSLHTLSMELCCSLTELPSHLIKHGSNLRVLYLKESPLSSLPDEIESHMPFLFVIRVNPEIFRTSEAIFPDAVELKKNTGAYLLKPITCNSHDLYQSILTSMAHNRYHAGTIDSHIYRAITRHLPLAPEPLPLDVPDHTYRRVSADDIGWEEEEYEREEPRPPYYPCVVFTEIPLFETNFNRSQYHRNASEDRMLGALLREMNQLDRERRSISRRNPVYHSLTSGASSDDLEPLDAIVSIPGGVGRIVLQHSSELRSHAEAYHDAYQKTSHAITVMNSITPFSLLDTVTMINPGVGLAAKIAQASYAHISTKKEVRVADIDAQIRNRIKRYNARGRAYEEEENNRRHTRLIAETERINTAVARRNQEGAHRVAEINRERKDQALAEANEVTEQNRITALASAQETVRARNQSRKHDLNVLESTCHMLKYVTLYTGVVCILIAIDKNPLLGDHELEILVNRFFPESSTGSFTSKAELIEALRFTVTEERFSSHILSSFETISTETYARIFKVPPTLFERHKSEITASLRKAITITNRFRTNVAIHAPDEIDRMLRENIRYTRKNGTETTLPFAYALVQTLNEFCETFINPLYDSLRLSVGDGGGAAGAGGETLPADDERRAILVRHLIELYNAHERIAKELRRSSIGRLLPGTQAYDECYVNGEQ